MSRSDRTLSSIQSVCGLLLCAASLSAQMTQPRSVRVQGELSQEGGGTVDGLWVELTDQGRPVQRVPANPDGGFQFSDLPTGDYEVRIVDWQGRVLRREFVSLHDNGAPIMIKLPKTEGSPAPGGPVSVRSLLHPVPSKARKEYLRAEKSLKEGSPADAVQHLQKAVELFPGYVEAHNNLGTRYMLERKYERAVLEFKTAVDLDPSSTVPQSNLAVALVTLKRYDEAADAARRALATDSDSPQARYALGLAAAGKGQCTEAALGNLKAAAQKFPKAHLAAATVLVCRRDPGAAATELRAYLASPGAENRPLVERWIGELEPAKMQSKLGDH